MTTSDHRFHRWVDPGERGTGNRHQAIDAADAERTALAAWLDIPAVRRFHADVTVSRQGADTALVSGTFVADVDLVCGVSLDIFPDTLRGAFEQPFRKAVAGHVRRPADAAEIEIQMEDEEIGEWTAHGIDLGALLAEELSLALPDFPRKPGAEPVPAGDPEDDVKPNPFAALAKLKGGDGTGGGGQE